MVIVLISLQTLTKDFGHFKIELMKNYWLGLNVIGCNIQQTELRKVHNNQGKENVILHCN